MKSILWLLVFALAVTAAGPVWAYGEDLADDDRSTAHYDLARAMARCAGFSAADSTTIAEADQATDTLAHGATAFAFTDRAGPFRRYFHFPEPGGTLDATGAGALRTWANGTSTLTDVDGTTLSICDAAGKCCDTEGRCVTGGSLQAVGVWLHAVGDYWSHHACSLAGGFDHTNYDKANADQTAYCAPAMHRGEWGARATSGYNVMLQANAIKGLQAMRDAIFDYATSRGMTACGAISDADLLTFASATTSTLRANAATSLYATCDAVAACAAPGDGSDDVSDGGCSSSLRGRGMFLLLMVVFVGVGLMAKRRLR